MTTSVSGLARLALARLPKPYTDEVVLHVFCEIERSPHLRRQYDKLVKSAGNGVVNREISKTVMYVLDTKKDGDIDVSEVCDIVGSVARIRPSNLMLNFVTEKIG